MLEICIFVVHVWWASMPLVVSMSPPNSNDDDNVLIHLADKIEKDIDSLDFTLASCSKL